MDQQKIFDNLPLTEKQRAAVLKKLNQEKVPAKKIKKSPCKLK
jgi:hypothetical protein